MLAARRSGEQGDASNEAATIDSLSFRGLEPTASHMRCTPIDGDLASVR